MIAIFDIGKTNKKLFLFDKDYQQVHQEYVRFNEIKDEDGHPTDDLQAIEDWLKRSFDELFASETYKVKSLNFSTYGASFVYIDKNGQPIGHLYNYTKDYPQEILESFYQKYGDPLKIARQTASPPLAMLNSGLQIYWLKYARPDLFAKVRYAMHLPQYLSYLFTGIPLSEFTSIGCHTALWDFEKQDYHAWVYAEGIDRILPPIVDTATSVNVNYQGRKLTIGVGIHDSSAALLPFVRSDRKPFTLISTGTWSISLNPFNQETLTAAELSADCLNYMRTDGKGIKAARLFLGNEYKIQVRILADHYQQAYEKHRSIGFDSKLYQQTSDKPHFSFQSLPPRQDQPSENRLEPFASYELAYHQLMRELVDLQAKSTQLAVGSGKIHKLYVDGGFTDNDIFVKLLSAHFPDQKLRTTKAPLGSALGAALVMSGSKTTRKFLKKHYALRKHTPLILR
ncbi:MAG: FGGY family carbohydrate kinase [Bacteroidota bacterium]